MRSTVNRDTGGEPILERAAPRPGGAPGALAGRIASWVLPAAALVGLTLAWQGFVVILDIPRWLVPAPSDIARALWEGRGGLRGHFNVTLTETLVGYFVAVAAGIPLGVVVVYSKILERTIYPILLAMQSVPKIAIAPVLVLWMGFGLAPKVVLIFLICIFPIVIAAATGLKATPPEFIEMVRSLSASQVKAFTKVRFPAALPHIFVGLKVAISLAVIGAVIGEFVGSNRGLGFVIILSQGNVRTDLAFASIFLLTVMAIALFYLLVALERLVVPWAQYEEER